MFSTKLSNKSKSENVDVKFRVAFFKESRFFMMLQCVIIIAILRGPFVEKLGLYFAESNDANEDDNDDDMKRTSENNMLFQNVRSFDKFNLNLRADVPS